MKRIAAHAIPEPAREPIETPAPAPAPVIAQPTEATLALLEAAVRRLLREVNGSPRRRGMRRSGGGSVRPKWRCSCS